MHVLRQLQGIAAFIGDQRHALLRQRGRRDEQKQSDKPVLHDSSLAAAVFYYANVVIRIIADQNNYVGILGAEIKTPPRMVRSDRSTTAVVTPPRARSTTSCSCGSRHAAGAPVPRI